MVVITAANRRIDAWGVMIHPRADTRAQWVAPANFSFARGVLEWSKLPDAVSYQITPRLIKPAASYTDTEVHPHAIIQTTETRLDLSRQLLPGASYQFEIAAVDRSGRLSAVARSAQVVMGQ